MGLLRGQSKIHRPPGLHAVYGAVSRYQVRVHAHLTFDPPSLPQPFLPPSDSGALYDSDESGASDNDDDDDAFLSDTQMAEHSDPNSFRCGISGSFPVSHELQRGMIHDVCVFPLCVTVGLSSDWSWSNWPCTTSRPSFPSLGWTSQVNRPPVDSNHYC